MTTAETVCVTGAGGYIASWLVKLLLSHNYTVHGTARDPEDAKYNHLKELDKAPERLKLFKADLLDYNSLYAAIKGCSGVFHVASPVQGAGSVSNPEVELVEPVVKGAENVLKACSAANVKRTVVVSSIGAVLLNPDWPEDQIKDETCWSDRELCKKINHWYSFSKTAAESEALEYAKKHGLDVVTFCPALVLGPMLQREPNVSSLVLINLLKACLVSSEEEKLRLIVDVRDVASALLLVFEKPEAEGRYICTAHPVTLRRVVEILRAKYPSYKYPKSFKEFEGNLMLSSEKLQTLGWTYRPLEETLFDSVEHYKAAGFLD